MSRPNLQRIMEAHGKLPGPLAEDLGVTVITHSKGVGIVEGLGEKEHLAQFNAANEENKLLKNEIRSLKMRLGKLKKQLEKQSADE